MLIHLLLLILIILFHLLGHAALLAAYAFDLHVQPLWLLKPLSLRETFPRDPWPPSAFRLGQQHALQVRLSEHLQGHRPGQVQHNLPKSPFPLCRDGAPPNVQNIHFKILEEGFDRTRPAVGICVKYLSEQGKRDLLEHNRRFTRSSNLLPLSMRRPCMDP